MTLREAREFLVGKKVFVKYKRKEVQEKLFNIGFKWAGPREEEFYEDRYFLFLHDDLKITYINDIGYFYEHEFEEISVEDILNIEINPLPKTWEEFCKNNPINVGEVVLNSCGVIIPLIAHRTRYTDTDKCSLPNSSAAKAHMALMQLHQLRDCYRGNVDPYECQYAIVRGLSGLIVVKDLTVFLSFQSSEIAQEFLNNFRDLIEQAGDLI